MRALSPDLLVSIYFNQRLGKGALAISPRGAINLHPSLLPKHRGPLPHFWVVAAGDKYTGVTVHWINDRIDDGDIVRQRELPVPAGASVSTLMGLVVRPGATSLVNAVRLIEAGQAPRHPQDASAAIYEKWPTQRDLIRVWRQGGSYGSGSELVAACEANRSLRRPMTESRELGERQVSPFRVGANSVGCRRSWVDQAPYTRQIHRAAS